VPTHLANLLYLNNTMTSVTEVLGQPAIFAIFELRALRRTTICSVVRQYTGCKVVIVLNQDV